MSRSGFTVLELAIATLIVAVSMIPIISMFSSGARIAAFDEYHVAGQGLGLSLIERTIEDLMVGGFRVIEKKQQAKKAAGFSQDAFNYELTATPVDGAGWLWQVTANITWSLPTDPQGFRHGLLLERLLSRPDVCFTGKTPYRRIMDPGS